MKRIFVQPTRPNLIIRDPKNKIPIPREGKFVNETTYWRRRIKDGDLVIIIKPKVQDIPEKPEKLEKPLKISNEKLKESVIEKSKVNSK